jgi:16S rRNA (guanine966-N2)-methyltransferase
VKPGVRITGGEYRGRGLAVPPGARPTAGRVREALFAVWRERLEGARFLDLFAGSGAMGLEAVGRGALHALCVDDSARAVRLLAANVEKLGAGGVGVRRLSLPAGLSRLATDGPFDLVFADPPYAFGAYDELLAGIAPLLAADAEIAVEHSSRRDLPLVADRLVRVDVRRYSESAVSFYTPATPRSPSLPQGGKGTPPP